MKKLIIIIIVFFSGISLSNAQFFADSPEEGANENQQQNTRNFFQDTPESGGESGLTQKPPLPNPGEESPIDQWVFLLPLVGIMIGFYYLNQKSKKQTI
ncbi:MAG: hypothetical protein RBT46_06205 [Weeksellaceae bacterium]|jgi:hypothetical protein|nr:hypothetical protein [Weeksellaceae bacterium]